MLSCSWWWCIKWILLYSILIWRFIHCINLHVLKYLWYLSYVILRLLMNISRGSCVYHGVLLVNLWRWWIVTEHTASSNLWVIQTWLAIGRYLELLLLEALGDSFQYCNNIVVCLKVWCRYMLIFNLTIRTLYSHWGNTLSFHCSQTEQAEWMSTWQ